MGLAETGKHDHVDLMLRYVQSEPWHHLALIVRDKSHGQPAILS